MKVLVILAAVICVASAATLTLKDNHKKIIVNALQKEIVRRTRGPGPDGILPPIDDPLKVNDTKIDFADYPNEFIEGFAAIANCIVEGLSTLEDELEFNLIALTLKGDVKVAKAAIETDLEAAALVHLPISGGEGKIDAAAGSHFSGSLETFSLTDLFAKLHVNLITDRGTISDLEAFVHFDGVIFVNGVGISWNDAEVEWEQVNADLPAFIEDLLANNHDQIIDIAEVIVNLILADIPISDLIDLIG